MQKIFYSFCFLFLAINAQAQTTPAITMTTSSEIGNTFSFGIGATANSTPIQVDWGNGILVDHVINETETFISSTLLGNTIKIYGMNIIDLNVQYKKITELDITKATSLKYLYCSLNEISNLDISNNIALIILNCHSNKLTTIDISKNTELETISCDNNQICSLDVSQNNKLTIVYCTSNNLTFNTLPIKKPIWTAYTYSPQAALNLPKNKYSINEEINLSSQLTANGNTTNYSWKTKGGTTLTAGTDYIITNGVTKFIKVPTDSVYCEMTNTTFPDLTLSTKSIAVFLPAPNITFSTSTTIGNTFSFGISTIANSTPIQVDWGDGLIKNYTIGEISSNVSNTLYGNTIKIYGIGISELDILSKKIKTIDISGATAIKKIYCASNELTTLNVTKNTALIELYCSSNQLTNLNVTSNILLTLLHCSYNQLTALDVTKNNALSYLNCFNNKLSSLDVSMNSELTLLDCSSNQITDLDLTKNSLLTTIFCKSNQIAELKVSKDIGLTLFDCRSNKLVFSSLPTKQSTWDTYVYSPQAKMRLDKKQYNLSETIDLSSQLKVNDNTTSYIWKTKGGLTLTSGTDYTSTGGVTTFLKVPNDSIYCQMTNATFPLLTLSTINIKVTDPTSIETDLSGSTKIYPNPVSNLLWIESEEVVKRVEIFTIVGIKVFEQEYNTTQKVNINITELPRGLLIVKVYGMNGIMEKKILKE